MQPQDTESLVYFKLVPALVANKNRIIGGLSALVLIILLFLFVSWHKNQKEVNAGQAFSQLWVSAHPGTSPADLAGDYLKIAGDYADTQTGQRALLQGATVLFSAGNYADAQTQFQKFADTYPNSALISTAVLGVASSLEAQGKADAALDAYRKVLDSYTDPATLVSAKFALARILEQQGKVADALRYYEEIARSASGSALGQQANLKAVELAATLPKTPAPPMATPTTGIPMMPPSK
jgi:TolA-binding protein